VETHTSTPLFRRLPFKDKEATRPPVTGFVPLLGSVKLRVTRVHWFAERLGVVLDGSEGLSVCAVVWLLAGLSGRE